MPPGAPYSRISCAPSGLRSFASRRAMDNANPRPYHRAMQPGQPSRTALGAAGLRAAHQVLDAAAIFEDPLALRILGADADALLREAEAETDPYRQRLRWFIAARSRIANDALAA